MLNLKKAMCLGVAIILCLSFMLAGCGDKKEQNEVQQTKEVTGEKKGRGFTGSDFRAGT